MKNIIFENEKRYIDIANKRNNRKDRHKVICAVFFLVLLGIVLISYILCYNESKSPEKVILMKTTIKYDSIPVYVTIYRPTVQECDNQPFETADGSIINPNKPQRWCGASRDIVNIIGYGNKITIHIPLAPILSGEYWLHDTDNGRSVRHIDILVANPDVCCIRGKWQGYIIYNHKN